MDNHRHLGVKLLIVIAMLLVGHGGARADVGDVRRLTRTAMEAYDLMDFETARKRLKEAIAAARKSGAARSKEAARAHLNLGIVYYGGFDDPQQTRRHFRDAVTIDPRIELGFGYHTDELEAILDEMRAQAGKSAGQKQEHTPVDCSKVRGLDHEPIAELPAGRDASFRALISERTPAEKVWLHLRTPRAGGFVRFAMERAGTCEYIATIPARALSGTRAWYYLSAVSGSGQVLATAGTDERPNEVAFKDDGRGPAWQRDDGLFYTDGDETFVEATPPEVGGPFVSLGFGTGGGYSTGLTELAGRQVTCCVSSAPFHLHPELGYRFTEQTHLSLAVRFGFPLGANLPDSPKSAPAGLLRVRRSLARRGDGFVVTGSVGGGIVRQTVKLGVAKDGGDTDTAAMGPFLVGGGFGYILGTGAFRVIGEANALAGLPLGFKEFQGAQVYLGINVDFNVSVMVAF